MGGADFQSQSPALTLKEALAAPRLNRDMDEAAKPMPNFTKTAGAPHDMPLTFWATWTLPSRPRRIALLLDDAQEEYRAYAEPIIANMTSLVNEFRAKGCPIMWSSWSRQFDDGISNVRVLEAASFARACNGARSPLLRSPAHAMALVPLCFVRPRVQWRSFPSTHAL